MKAALSVSLSALMLTACVYVPAEYTAGPVHGDPKKIVERIMYEQPESKRPQYVEVHDDYLEFGEGSPPDLPICGSVAAAMFTGGISCLVHHGQDINKKDVTRLYYRTMVEAKLLDRTSLKGHWYIVEPRTAQGRKLADVYVADRKDAENFIDALMALHAAVPATE
ncbi:hypothetical protein CI15_18970 [Paraburkholderia monticola]|uniref:Uncharacterized protein n=1 Tax=Paraburkholderia monticola TaxID=1399968 RepID=A0A149PN87_9BURK|nr:hypothetical protein [Paraburkholderia monticola]KXU86521.1 hypothetical protein CI15_18970 [Paraburkholderia monticola]